MKVRDVQRFILLATLPAVCSIVLAIVLFQSNAFDAEGAGFQFVAFGIIGGVFYAGFKVLPRLVFALVLIVLFIVDEYILRSSGMRNLWQNAVYLIGSFASLFGFVHYYEAKLKKTFLAAPLLLGSLFSVCYIIIALLLYFIFGFTNSGSGINLTQMIYYDSAQGFLLGIGIGTGIALTGKFLLKKNP